MMTLEEIEALIKSKLYDEALSACDAFLNANPEALPEVCRLRSWVFTRQGKYQMGVEELVRVIGSGRASIADFHSAAFWSLYDEQFLVAKEWFGKVLDLGATQGDSWFEPSALFYLSYIYLVQGNYRMANKFLERSGSNDDDTPVLIPNIGSCTRAGLLEEINRRVMVLKTME